MRPVPRLRVERLANQPDQVQAVQILAAQRVVPGAAQHPQGGGRGEDLRHAVPADDLVRAGRGGRVDAALVDDMRRAVRQSAHQREDREGQPAHVRRAPVLVAGVEVQGPLHVRVRAGQEAQPGVHEALGFAGGAAGVDDEARIVRVQSGGVGAACGGVQQRVEVQVAGPQRRAGLHAAGHDDLRAQAVQRLVQGVAQGHDLPAPQGGVGAHHDLRLRVLQPVAHRRGAEAREDHRVDRPDAVAGVNGDERLRDVPQVDRHPVALRDAQVFERGGEAGGGVGQRAERPGLAQAVLALVAQRHALGGVAVEAVCADVPGRAGEVLEVPQRAVQGGGGRRDPGEFPGDLQPVGLRVEGAQPRGVLWGDGCGGRQGGGGGHQRVGQQGRIHDSGLRTGQKRAVGCVARPA